MKTDQKLHGLCILSILIIQTHIMVGLVDFMMFLPLVMGNGFLAKLEAVPQKTIFVWNLVQKQH